MSKLPLIRKIIVVGGSKAVTIPKHWLEYYEKEFGKPIENVAVEVNGILKIKPLIPKGKRKQG